MQSQVRAIKLKKKNSIAIPIPKNIGTKEGDIITITVIDKGKILIEKTSVDEGIIIDGLREGVISRGFQGNDVKDIIKGCKEWFKKR